VGFFVVKTKALVTVGACSTTLENTVEELTNAAVKVDEASVILVVKVEAAVFASTPVRSPAANCR
jgi:hypothetical protein